MSTNTVRKAFITVLSVLVLWSFGAASEKPLASDRLIQALTTELSGIIAHNNVATISRFDRVQASEGFHDAAVWIRDELEKMGYKDAVLEGWPSDGTLHYATYRSVIGWKARKAELWMTSPSRERLCDFAEMPITLVKHSGSAHCEAEIVDVGTGLGEAAYEGCDVKGKIVLATAYTEDVMHEAVFKRGALGILTYYPADERPGFPDMIRYTALWPRWEQRERMPFGFNISKNQGARLKRLLGQGVKIVLKADVETEFYKSKLETLSVSFPGTDAAAGEIMIIGHLCHPAPSANDNASGSGAMLEMARALKAMVDKGLVEAPRRTIRFVWVPEFNGTYPYIMAHRDRIRNTVAAINCDMIGEDICLSGAPLEIYRTPDSLPSVINDVSADFAALVEKLNLVSINGSTHRFVWKSSPYSGGSDHVIFDDGALRIPCIMINHDDVFHHTSLDTIDKVDPTALRRSSFITLGTALYLAQASDREAADMARLVARHAIGRIGGDVQTALDALNDVDGPDALHAAYAQVLNVSEHSVRREKDAVASAGSWADNPSSLDPLISALRAPFDALGLALSKEAHTVYRSLCAQHKTAERGLSLTAREKELSLVVPVRDPGFIGSLDPSYLVGKLGSEILKGWPPNRMFWYEALNFSDGRRSIQDIVMAVRAEYGPFDPEGLVRFFEALEKGGLMTLKRREGKSSR